MNRVIFLVFLDEHRKMVDKSNILVDNITVMLSSRPVVATIRLRAMIYIKICQPLIFFTNSKEVGFSPVDMGPVADLLYDFISRLKTDGSLIIDINLDIFEGLKDNAETLEAYKAYVTWKTEELSRKGETSTPLPSLL